MGKLAKAERQAEVARLMLELPPAERSQSKLAAYFGVSKTIIRRDLRDLKIKPTGQASAAGLPPEERKARVLELYHDMTCQEIADELGCSVEPVKRDVQTLAREGLLEIRPAAPRRRHPDAASRECDCGCGESFVPPAWRPDAHFVDWEHYKRWKEAQASGPSMATVRCFCCGADFDKLEWQVRRAEAASRRIVCATCWPIWTGGLLRARWAVHADRAAKNIEAFRAALAIGNETQTAIRRERPPKFGSRPRNVARALVVEVLHVTRGLSDTEIRLLWRLEFGEVGDQFVKRLRQESQIRRRAA